MTDKICPADGETRCCAATKCNEKGTEQRIQEIASCLWRNNAANFNRSFHRAGLKLQAQELIRLLRSAMYPQVFGRAAEIEEKTVALYLREAAACLREIAWMLLEDHEQTERLTCRFLAGLPDIMELLQTDIQAAYEGDPASRSHEEIILAYPAFEAISIYRLAHLLFTLELPLLPRIMTEYAHQITGIDIHPGATIGSYFFIDHGTGVVIGETCVIGDHVKLYQGVTLGARSFQLDEQGKPIKGILRHPQIGNHVVIYAGATILGGDTRIGDHCVVGGNVWLTHSLAPGKRIYNKAEENNGAD